MGFKKQTYTGFTIVELLIVIVVIAILAAITVVSYRGISREAGTSMVKSDLRNSAQQMELIKAEKGTYPASFPLNSKVSDRVVLVYGNWKLTSAGVQANDDSTAGDLNPADYPYYDLSSGVSQSDPKRTQIIAARNGVLLENICKSLLTEGWGKGPADWNASETIDYVSNCAVYENNAIQITTWQQFIDQNKLIVPLDSAKIQAYIAAAKNYNGGAHPSLGVTVEKFINRLMAIHDIQGGTVGSAIFYDPSANEYWGVPKPTLPSPTTRPAGNGGTGSTQSYCIEGYVTTNKNEVWHISNGSSLKPGACA